MTAPHSHSIRRAGTWDATAAADRVVLDYAARFLRRKRLITETGAAFLVDLAQTESLDAGDAFELSDGRLIAVEAAAETLIELRGPDLARLAWHIGNRHTPCQIEGDRLLIAEDHVLEAMLVGLGAEVAHVTAAFRPEGGAYGHGRTMGHDHGHSQDHGHSHGHSHGHGQVHHHAGHEHGDPLDAHDHHSHDPHE